MAETTMASYRCERCGHEWPKRTSEKPRRCAKCGSPYWDVPKRDVAVPDGAEG